VGRLAFVGLIGIGLYVFTQGGSKAATVTQTCAPEAPGVVRAAFSWRAPKTPPREAWLDLSLLESFSPGWYQAYGPFVAGETSHVVPDVPLGAKVHFRVNALQSDGTWRVTAKGSFDAQCPPPPTPVPVHPTATPAVDVVPVA
jgi:hypothetical protein